MADECMTKCGCFMNIVVCSMTTWRCSLAMAGPCKQGRLGLFQDHRGMLRDQGLLQAE